MNNLSPTEEMPNLAGAFQAARHVADAFASLSDELMHALRVNPHMQVRVPGFDPQSTRAVEAAHFFIGTDELASMLQIMGQIALRQDDVLGQRAAMWLGLIANQHGRFHAEDLVSCGSKA